MQLESTDEVLKAECFEEPFRSMFLDIEARCRELYEPLRQHLKSALD